LDAYFWWQCQELALSRGVDVHAETYIPKGCLQCESKRVEFVRVEVHKKQRRKEKEDEERKLMWGQSS